MDQAEETITDTEALDAEARDRLFHENVDYFERMGVESHQQRIDRTPAPRWR